MKNMINKMLTASSLFAALFLGTVIAISAQSFDKFEAVADDNDIHGNRCTANTVRGSYGFSGTGTILPGAPLPPSIPAGPYATIGRITFDGHGGLASVVSDNFSGFITPFTSFTGVYSVSKDCTGSVSINGGVPYRFVVLDGGKEIVFMVNVPGTLIAGSGKKL